MSRELYEAIENRDAAATRSIVESLRERNSEFSIDDRAHHNATPMEWSIKLQAYEISSLLLDLGASVKTRPDDGGATLLHKIFAELKFDEELPLVRKLIQLGVDINSKMGFQASSPLHEALRSYRAEAALLLISAGCLVDQTYIGGNTELAKVASMPSAAALIDALLAAGADINRKNDAGRTSLHLAAFEDNHHAVRKLAAAGANVHATCDLGETPIEACKGSLTMESALTRLVLIAYGANPSLMPPKARAELKQLPFKAPARLTMGRTAVLCQEPDRLMGIVRQDLPGKQAEDGLAELIKFCIENGHPEMGAMLQAEQASQVINAVMATAETGVTQRASKP